MRVAAYLDTKDGLEIMLPWVIRIARARTRQLDLYVPAQVKGKPSLEVPLAGSETNGIREHIKAFLDEFVGPEWWTTADPNESADDTRLHVSLTLLSQEDPIEALLHCIEGVECLIASVPDAGSEESDTAERRRRLMRDARCEVVMLRPARDGDHPGAILAPAARGPHSRAAIQLARDVALETSQPLTTLYVEPDIGPDAMGVGQRILDQLVVRALGSANGEVTRRVEVGAKPDRVVSGILETEPFGLVVLGTSRLGARGDRLRGSVGLGIVQASPQTAVAVARAAVPLRGRTRRRLELLLQGRVPQLERDDRIGLVERVQSNSHWDFDFVALMSLSALIAAMGLIQDSAAVIIGAMLVAPLMTPLLGLGVALVQGNPALARISLRSVGYGFATVFVLSFLTGAANASFVVLTPEMHARGWPLLLDLFVAFVSGLAAAYASSRPNLVAALPGVAIAAALVPPIATAGLAASIGELRHAAGALLLFFTNMVAIVLATSVSMWAVGLRVSGSGSRLTRAIGTTFALAAFGLSIALAVSPTYDRERATVPNDLYDALAREIPDDQRLRDVYFRRGALVIQVAGEAPPEPELAIELSNIAHARLGAGLPVRIQGIWEAIAPAAR